MAGTVKVTVHSASNLRVTQMFGKQDPYCKVSAGRRSYKTRVAEDAHTDAMWNQTFQFPGSPRSFNFMVYNQNSLSDTLIGEVRIAPATLGRTTSSSCRRRENHLVRSPSHSSGRTTTPVRVGAMGAVPLATGAVAVGDVGSRVLRATIGGTSGAGQVTVSGAEQSALRSRSNSLSRSRTGSAQFVTGDKASGEASAAAVVAPVGGGGGDVPMFANPIAAPPAPPAETEGDDDGSAMFVTDHVKTVSPEAEERARQRRAAREEAQRAEEQRGRGGRCSEAAAAAAAEQEARRSSSARRTAAESSGAAAAQRSRVTSVSDKQRLPPLPSVNGRRR